MNELKSFPEKPEKIPFGVPEGYFESLSDRILTQIDSNHVVKVIPLYVRYKYQIIASAAVLLLFVGFNWMTKESKSLKVDQDQIEYYLSYNQYLNTYDLVSLMEEDAAVIDIGNSFETSDIESYLLKNNDIEWLLENDEQP